MEADPRTCGVEVQKRYLPEYYKDSETKNMTYQDVAKQEQAKEKKGEKAEEGEEVMQAIQEIPTAAQSLAQEVRDKIEALTQDSGLGPEALASIVAELIQAKYQEQYNENYD